MLQLKNSSPFAATVLVFPNQQAVDTLYTAVKATFELWPKVAIAEQQRPVTLVDEYWGEPGESSLRYPSEAHLEKPGTDVIVVGEACAPDERPVTQLEIGASIDRVKRTARVFGDRVWEKRQNSLRPSAPRPFSRLPLVYERCYGGTVAVDAAGGELACEALNPIGCGFRGPLDARELEGKPLPNVEDPRRLLQAPGDATVPVGFGAMAPAWRQRARYAGTYDAHWQKTRAPYLPLDFDPRFFNVAPEGWTFPRHLRGGEPIAVSGMSPHGILRFGVPVCGLRMKVHVGATTVSPPLALETLVIEPTLGQLTMTWRAAMPCDKKILKVRQVSVTAGVMKLA